ncbi:MAG: hypothetical protein OWQ48_00705 [Desulfurococcus sp.]|nr:hypothetical protein [Desulfurococcus sp.]
MITVPLESMDPELPCLSQQLYCSRWFRSSRTRVRETFRRPV